LPSFGCTVKHILHSYCPRWLRMKYGSLAKSIVSIASLRSRSRRSIALACQAARERTRLRKRGGATRHAPMRWRRRRCRACCRSRGPPWRPARGGQGAGVSAQHRTQHFRVGAHWRSEGALRAQRSARTRRRQAATEQHAACAARARRASKRGKPHAPGSRTGACYLGAGATGWRGTPPAVASLRATRRALERARKVAAATSAVAQGERQQYTRGGRATSSDELEARTARHLRHC